MTLHPAATDSGIVFQRADLPGLPQLRASLATARATPLGLTLRAGSLRIDGVELLLAALAGCGIDNAVIELDGPEPPEFDGSAATFAFLIACAGRAPQDAARKAVEVTNTVRLSGPGRYALLRPGSRPRLRLRGNCGERCSEYRLSEDDFARELAPARRVLAAERVEALKARGLLRGWEPGRGLVRRDGQLISAQGPRCPDEDLRFGLCSGLGVLSLLGGPLQGALLLRGGPPGMILRLLRRLMAEESSYRWTDLPEPEAESPGALPAAAPDKPRGTLPAAVPGGAAEPARLAHRRA